LTVQKFLAKPVEFPLARSANLHSLMAKGASMKVLVFVKATPNSEQGIFPPDTAKLFADMGKFNEQLVKAGIMQEADGLKPSSSGKRITFSDEGHTAVVDGPFAETKELVAGYWVWNVKSMDEAVEWAKRCPNPMPGEQGVLEIRPTNTLDDFAELLTDEQRERFERGSRKMERQKKVRGKAKAKRKPTRGKARRQRAPR
jgi:hypothetical protein